jgi:hypothetical protein
MKGIFCLLLIIISFSAFTQKYDLPVDHIDRSVRAYTNSASAILVKEITSGSQTDREKVSAIFRWITENITYNVKVARASKNLLIYEEPDDDTSRVLKPLNLRVAELVYKRRSAICDGYSRLFKTMCDYAGIPSEIIMGYAKTGAERRRAGFRSNHNWNAVYIDSAWYLLDATWASGVINHRGDEFIKQYEPKYFLTPPSQFIIDHYPEDVRWTLLKDPPTLNEFNFSPLRYMGYIKTGIKSYWPAKGVIEASVGDSIQFEVEASIMQGLLEVVSGDQPVDTIWNDDEPVIIGGRKKSYTYKITEKTGDWLYVICNGYVVLRYRLNILRPENKTAVLSSQ